MGEEEDEDIPGGYMNRRPKFSRRPYRSASASHRGSRKPPPGVGRYGDISQERVVTNSATISAELARRRGSKVPEYHHYTFGFDSATQVNEGDLRGFHVRTEPIPSTSDSEAGGRKTFLLRHVNDQEYGESLQHSGDLQSLLLTKRPPEDVDALEMQMAARQVSLAARGPPLEATGMGALNSQPPVEGPPFFGYDPTSDPQYLAMLQVGGLAHTHIYTHTRHRKPAERTPEWTPLHLHHTADTDTN